MPPQPAHSLVRAVLTALSSVDLAPFGGPLLSDIRRFLLHVLPKGFHRIRHYGLLATGTRADNIERARKLLGIEAPNTDTADMAAPVDTDDTDLPPCPCCGSRLRIIETFLRGETPRHRASPRPLVFRIDTS